tara:strand:- start:326 stop:973 length:648 start_codon:yes stop_codon:yes gene_type:complete
MTSEALTDEIKQNYIKLLNTFDHLSVREKSALKIFKTSLNKDVVETLDPVLLHEAEYWDKFVSKSIKYSDYDLRYVNNSNYFQNLSLKKRRIINIGSFNITDVFRPGFKIRNHYGPAEFIFLIKNATTVYTTSFHAVIMCLIYNKPFFVHLTENKGRDSRITNLLTKFDLLDRCIYNSEEIDTKTDADFTLFNEKIVGLRRSTYQFIETSLCHDQ